jgi:hypothetical protein
VLIWAPIVWVAFSWFQRTLQMAVVTLHNTSYLAMPVD